MFSFISQTVSKPAFRLVEPYFNHGSGHRPFFLNLTFCHAVKILTSKCMQPGEEDRLCGMAKCSSSGMSHTQKVFVRTGTIGPMHSSRYGPASRGFRDGGLIIINEFSGCDVFGPARIRPLHRNSLTRNLSV